MKKLESTFMNMVLSLVLIAAVAAAALAGVFLLTKENIENKKIEKRQNAIKEVVLPGAGPEAVITILSSDTVDNCVVHVISHDHHFIGAAIETEAIGFGGKQKIMVGLNPEGEVINYKVLEHQETPGLGDKIKDWFKTDANNQNIIGRKAGTLFVNKEGGNVDAITAATISSKAFLKAIRLAYVAFMDDEEVEAVAMASRLQHEVEQIIEEKEDIHE